MYMKTLLYNLTGEIYESGQIPNDFKKSIMIMIPKKSGTKKCD